MVFYLDDIVDTQEERRNAGKLIGFTFILAKNGGRSPPYDYFFGSGTLR
jgi:hypothetical protein